MPQEVNPQITDAVTETNVSVVAEAPAMAVATLYQTMAHSLSLLMENAVAAQQQLNIAAQAATTQGVMQIYSVDTISDSIAAAQTVQSGTSS
ncbi:MAG: RebB family R body protein [Rhodobacter sp.]|nr:RebB family R body protein [Rhodobacter sp.]